MEIKSVSPAFDFEDGRLELRIGDPYLSTSSNGLTINLPQITKHVIDELIKLGWGPLPKEEKVEQKEVVEDIKTKVMNWLETHPDQTRFVRLGPSHMIPIFNQDQFELDPVLGVSLKQDMSQNDQNTHYAYVKSFSQDFKYDLLYKNLSLDYDSLMATIKEKFTVDNNSIGNDSIKTHSIDTRCLKPGSVGESILNVVNSPFEGSVLGYVKIGDEFRLKWIPLPKFDKQ